MGALAAFVGDVISSKAMSVIDDDVRRVIMEAGCSMTMGTRDARLEPHFARVMGAVVHDDRTHVTLFVPRALVGQTLSDLEDNGRIAFQAVEPGIFHAFQLKGRYVSHRDANGDEEAMQIAYRDRTIDLVRKYHMSHGFWSEALFHPAVAITFSVEESYTQTPGPGAGAPRSAR
jgi:hypothetical protein